MVVLIVLQDAATSWAYVDPDSFSQHFTQEHLITFWFVTNVTILILYMGLCLQAKFNVYGLWLAAPMSLLGMFLIGYAYSQLGTTRTFFGVELGVIEKREYTGFPFSLGHAQYKGCIFFLLGVWCAFRHTHELTAMTGVWIVSFLVQMLIETGPAGNYEGKELE